jgi:hypothetical protein
VRSAAERVSAAYDLYPIQFAARHPTATKIILLAVETYDRFGEQIEEMIERGYHALRPRL